MSELIKAVKNNNIDKVRNLIEEKVNVNSVTFSNNNETPLFLASQAGHVGIVKLLIAVTGLRGLNSSDKFLRTPLYVATSNGHVGIVKLLIKAGANYNSRNSDDMSALEMASYLGHADIVKLLIEANASRDGLSKWGNTPLHEASSEGHVECVKLLIKGASANVNINIKNTNGETPLYVAMENEHWDVVKLLIEAGADPTIQDKEGEAPIDNKTVEDIYDTFNRSDPEKRLALAQLLYRGPTQPNLNEPGLAEAIARYLKEAKSGSKKKRKKSRKKRKKSGKKSKKRKKSEKRKKRKKSKYI
jgi:ankyrin repeat protein